MSALTSEVWPTRQHNDELSHRDPRALAVIAVVSLMLSIGLLLTVRRLGGAFSADLPRSTLFLTAIISVAIAASSRIVWRQLYPLDLENVDSFSWSDQFVGWGSSLVPLLMMVGCSFLGDRLSEMLIWIPLLVCDQLWRQNFFDGGYPEYQIGRVPQAIALQDAMGWETVPTDTQSVPGNCTQQLFRVRESDGQEAIYATLRVDFETGQRHATAHVGFCPPLGYRPTIEADPYEGPQAEVKIVQALSHGARIDLKLARVAEGPTQVFVDLAARNPDASNA
ncbi:hypothetical protein [Bythopirellula goksoeyrii]|uniref:Uncharacterized protein n=1 Tax=Bythopirellula goksoeyrii TaxID=1400387 RepID=A0A5B9QHD5_9BACT|nr:hypothetical protein [Bythopirellula goksoeyrii]QEG37042.1 hypothetical protein Pr1d_43820 [Bythopirellula goksoeyrii]